MCPKSMPCSQGSSSSASIQAMSCKSSPKEVGESSVSSGCNRVSIMGGVLSGISFTTQLLIKIITLLRDWSLIQFLGLPCSK